MNAPTQIPLSVFIIAKNEEVRIPYTLRSVIDWVDEVIVVDSGSTDNTVALSESLGAKVLHRDWEGFGPQKVFAEQACRNDWVLNLDADEEIGAKLAQNIRKLFANGEPSKSAYSLVRRFIMFDQKRPSIFAERDEWVRLYDRRRAGFKDSIVHDSVVVRDGETGTLKGSFYHRGYLSLNHAWEKFEFYSTLQAEDMFQRGRTLPRWRLITEPILAFFKCYLLRRHFAYGVNGIVLSYIYAHARLLRIIKTRDLFRAAKAEHKY